MVIIVSRRPGASIAPSARAMSNAQTRARMTHRDDARGRRAGRPHGARRDVMSRGSVRWTLRRQWRQTYHAYYNARDYSNIHGSAAARSVSFERTRLASVFTVCASRRFRSSSAAALIARAAPSTLYGRRVKLDRLARFLEHGIGVSLFVGESLNAVALVVQESLGSLWRGRGAGDGRGTAARRLRELHRGRLRVCSTSRAVASRRRPRLARTVPRDPGGRRRRAPRRRAAAAVRFVSRRRPSAAAASSRGSIPSPRAAGQPSPP